MFGIMNSCVGWYPVYRFSTPHPLPDFARLNLLPFYSFLLQQLIITRRLLIVDWY